MLISTLCSIVPYFLLCLSADSIFVSNRKTNGSLSISSQNGLEQAFLSKSGLLFVPTSSPNCSKSNFREETHRNISEFEDSYGKQRDSPINPVCYRNYRMFSRPSGTVVEYVNCAGSAPEPEPVFRIPYHEIQTCAFDGHESLEGILENLKEPLNHASRNCFYRQKAAMLEMGRTDFEANARRSIRALTYWVGSRTLNAAKLARDNSDAHASMTPEVATIERAKCYDLILNFAAENLELWNSNATPNPATLPQTYPDYAPDKLNDYVTGVWAYFNARVFRNMLPDPWELNFDWFDLLDEKHRNVLTKSGEMFALGEVEALDFPRLLYPNQLKNSPSALGNCIFRSMAKLFCDIYTAFGGVDYIDVVTNAFKFVDSDAAGEEGVNFTAVQKSYASLVDYNSELVAEFNAADVLGEEHDLNDPKALFLDTDHLPYFKNSFHLLSIMKADPDNSLRTYEESFKRRPRDISRGIWFGDQGLTVPVTEIGRSMANFDFDEFSNIIGAAVDDLLKLKQVQFNFVQNRVVATCLKFINALRSLEGYEMNFRFAQEHTTTNKTVERLNLPMIKSILFMMNLTEKCASTNSLYPLANDFVRKSPLAELVAVDQICRGQDWTTYEANAYSRFLRQKPGEPVKFIQEYLDASVPADDHDALAFLVNYYNFNLFSGRLPIDISVKFKYMDRLASNDCSPLLKVPTIYVNALFQKNKSVIARLILEECLKIFLKWSNKFAADPTKEPSSLDDVMEFNMRERMRNHFLNCAEQSISWPFYLDNFRIANEKADPEKDIYRAFTESFESEDVVKLVSDLTVRQDLSEAWEQKRLPVRDFLASLLGGVYELSHAVLANPASIKVTSKLSLNDLNLLENKFKQICDLYFHLLDPADNRLNAVLYLESLAIVEAAFNELREECIKNTLIYTRDLVEAISEVSNVLTNSVQVHRGDAGIALDKSTHACTAAPAAALSLDGVSAFRSDEKLSNEDASDLAYLLYARYNEFLFRGFLPSVEIRVADIDDLSDLEVDLTDFSRPRIVLSSVIDDVNLLNSQLVIQMVSLAHYFFRHVSAEDFVSQFGVEFRSAFGVVHTTKTNYIKSRMIPVNLEKKLNSTKGKRGHNKLYVDFVNSTIDYKTSDLVTLRANDFMFEVLEGRERFKHRDKLSNHYESLQTLRAFASHYFSALCERAEFTKTLIEQAKSEDLDRPPAAAEETPGAEVEPAPIEQVLSVFAPGMMQGAWVRKMLEHAASKLRTQGVELVLEFPDLNWQEVLDPVQQGRVIEFLARNPNQGLFRALTKSGALGKREAADLLVRCMYEHPASRGSLLSDASQRLDHSGPVDRTAPEVEVIRDAEAPPKAPVDDVAGFLEGEMSSILEGMPPEDHDAFAFFFQKLIDLDFAACRNVLNSCRSPSFLVEKSAQVLDRISAHCVVDEPACRAIRDFLHR